MLMCLPNAMAARRVILVVMMRVIVGVMTMLRQHCLVILADFLLLQVVGVVGLAHLDGMETRWKAAMHDEDV